MLRYILSLPGNPTQDRVAEFAAMFKDAVNDPNWRDLVVGQGIKITDVRQKETNVAARRAQRAGPKPR